MTVGIVGLGTYLPPAVRKNDWWPQSIVDGWGDRMAHRATRAEAPDPSALTAGQRLTLAAMNELASDPFRGARERRVMGADMTASQMEAHAAREAIARAGIEVSQIGAVLVQTPVPEHLMVNSASVVHQLLGLPRHCLTVGTEAACNALPMHVTLAEGLIAAGRARYVLSIHSSAITRVHGPSEPHSAWWGDGAAAAVIAKASDQRGVLSAVHNSDGSSCEALVLGVPERRWFEDGAITTYSIDRGHTRQMLMTLVDRAGETIAEALRRAGLDPSDVDFYASHQGTSWFTKATAEHAGLAKAKTISTFPYLANMNSVNVPFVLAMGEREGLIRDGSIVVTFSGGLGETWSSLVLRWGR